jgi:hypothetical protein
MGCAWFALLLAQLCNVVLRHRIIAAAERRTAERKQTSSE